MQVHLSSEHWTMDTGPLGVSCCVRNHWILLFLWVAGWGLHVWDSASQSVWAILRLWALGYVP